MPPLNKIPGTALSVMQLMANLTSEEYIESIRARINDSTTHGVPYYDPSFDYEPDRGTTHLNVLAQDGSAVALTSTVNYLSVTFRIVIAVFHFA